MTTPPRPSRLPELVTDAAGLAGPALIIAGVAQIYTPAAWIAAGVFLLAGAWLTARKSAG